MLRMAKKALYFVLVLVSATPLVSTPLALVLGIAVGITGINPWPVETVKWSKRLLQCSVVGLGFGLGLSDVLKAGGGAIAYTVAGIGIAMTVGWAIGRMLELPGKTATLISFGTAICGGSAIAAMAPVIKASDEDISVSLATVFSLNAVALILFPFAGHLVGLDQQQFGLWAALAIHDTSSVVGAATAYGGVAVLVGTTVKLARALWIMPSVAIAAWLNRSDEKTGIPLFIPGFLAAAAVRGLLPQFTLVWDGLFATARQALVVTIFLIGTGLSREVVRRLGVRPMLMGVLLWLIVSMATLMAVYYRLIR